MKIIIFIIMLASVLYAFAEKTKMEKMEEETIEAGRDGKRGVKKTYRAAKDSACEMINGKMNCAAKKMKHKIQNAADKVEDAVE